MGESVLAAFGDPALPFLERIQEGLSRHFDFIAANPDLPRFIVNEVSSKPERYDMMRQKIQPIIGMLVGNVQREMDGLAARGEIERVDVRHLMLDILSLNIFPFVAYPIIQPLIEDVVADRADFRRPAQTREYRDHHAAPQKTLIDHETNPYPVLLLHGPFSRPVRSLRSTNAAGWRASTIPRSGSMT